MTKQKETKQTKTTNNSEVLRRGKTRVLSDYFLNREDDSTPFEELELDLDNSHELAMI